MTAGSTMLVEAFSKTNTMFLGGLLSAPSSVPVAPVCSRLVWLTTQIPVPV